MSRGPGRIERAIERLVVARPDTAFLIDDLCWLIFPAIGTVERKHRVSVLRAANKVVARLPDWRIGEVGKNRGAPVGLFNYRSRRSIAHLLAKGSQLATSAQSRDGFRKRDAYALKRADDRWLDKHAVLIDTIQKYHAPILDEKPSGGNSQ